MEGRELITGTGEVPGFKVKMTELSARSELNAAQDADAVGDGFAERSLIAQWACWKRSVVSINDEKLDPAMTVEQFRDSLSPSQLRFIQVLYERIHGVSVEEADAFSKSIRIGV